VEIWELVAREHIRDTLARYNWSAVGADVKPIVRHNVANVLFGDVARDRAQVSCYFTVVTHIGLDHVGRYRDTLVPDGGIWRISHRKVSTGWAAPNSLMARPSR
jgi:hypothetical protein